MRKIPQAFLGAFLGAFLYRRAQEILDVHNKHKHELGEPNVYHKLDPRLQWGRVTHFFLGRRRGCSCTTCFRHPKRRIPVTEIYANRVKVSVMEKTLRHAGEALARGDINLAGRVLGNRATVGDVAAHQELT